MTKCQLCEEAGVRRKAEFLASFTCDEEPDATTETYEVCEGHCDDICEAHDDVFVALLEYKEAQHG